MKFVDVILPLNLPDPLTYGVPLQWQGQIEKGMRVEVELGKNKVYAGLVYQIHDVQPELYAVKPIKGVLDKAPLLSAQQWQLWEWVAQYYMCSLGDVMQAALPAHFKLMNEHVLVWNGMIETLPQQLSDASWQVAEVLQQKKILTLGEIRDLIPQGGMSAVIDELLVTELAFVRESLQETYKEKVEKRVYLSPAFAAENVQEKLVNDLSKSPKQLAVFFAYYELSKTQNQVSTGALLKKANATNAVLQAMVKKGVFEIKAERIDRLQYEALPEVLEIELDAAQAKALAQIKENWKTKDTVLLQGVTGSGKTALYIQLIKETIAAGKQVLLMLPEIGLSQHLFTRLYAYFGEDLGIYQSRFSNNERIEIWNKVSTAQYKVIAGARSALWLPFQDLGLIIVDEEHDSSYKQADPAPRFQARDTAIVYAKTWQAKVLLGTATPSIETFFNTQNGKYAWVQLTERYGKSQMPEVKIESAQNLVPALSNIISKPLLEATAQTLNKGKQVILFLNKRGYAPFLLCNNCGWVAKCHHCDVSLTYHKYSDKMHCHYCNSKYNRVVQCPQCGLQRVSAKSFGTEKIEEELTRVFPNVKIGRLDWDVVKGKNAYANIIQDFEKGKVQILVGTQMVVKGLDFENVLLVGVLSADSILSFPDFRVNERAFQLLEQVAGRAGRKEEHGLVIIQAYNKTNPVLQDVVHHDYFSFYKKEIEFRKSLSYPPFVRFIKISARHLKETVAAMAIQDLVQIIQQESNVQINGPAPALISRIKNQFIFEAWIKTGGSLQQMNQLKQKILVAIKAVKSKKGNANVFIICDVDP